MNIVLWQAWQQVSPKLSAQPRAHPYLLASL